MKNFKLKIKIAIASVILSLLFVGCGKDDDDTNKPQENNAPFAFIKEGNEWVYENS
jgi:hypothetical protein